MSSSWRYLPTFPLPRPHLFKIGGNDFSLFILRVNRELDIIGVLERRSMRLQFGAAVQKFLEFFLVVGSGRRRRQIIEQVTHTVLE